MSNPQPKQQPHQQKVVQLRDVKNALVEPPYSQEAEEAVLGAILVNPDIFFKISGIVKEDDFYVLSDKRMWHAMERLHRRGEAIDVLTLAEELSALGWLNDIGESRITDLVNSTPTSFHAEFYANIVFRASVRRNLMKASDEIKALALNEEMELKGVMDAAERKLLDVIMAARTANDRPVTPAIEVVEDSWNELDQARSGEANAINITTGLKDLDDMLNGGFWKQKVHIIGARPSTGKSSVIYCCAVAAARAGHRVAIFTAETGKKDVIRQMIATEIGVQESDIKLGNLTDAQYSAFVNVAGKIAKLDLHIDGSKTITPHDIYRRVRDVKPDIIFIDYLNVLSWPKISREDQIVNANPRTKMESIADALPKIAEDLNVALVAATQINRESEKGDDKRPRLIHLKEAGKIEEIADFVALLYRDAMHNDATEFPNQMDIIGAKNKLTGRTGTIGVYFDRTLRKVMDGSARRVDLRDLVDHHPDDDDRD